MALRHSLQTRLVILVVAAVLPLIGFSVYTAVRDAKDAIIKTQDTLQVSASFAATGLDGLTDSARSLLAAMSHSAEVRNGTRAQCEAYATSIRESFPQYANFGVIDPSGRIRCSSRAGGVGIDLSDRQYFRDAVSRADFAVGEYMTSRVSNADSVGFGMPMYDADNKLTGVVYAAMEISAFSRIVADAKLPVSGRLTVLDRTGTVLAAQTDGVAPIGQKARTPLLREAAQRGVGGVGEGVDPQGRRRIYAFEPGRGSAAGALMVVISMNRDQVVAPILRMLTYELALLLLLTLLGGMLAWAVGGRALVTPVQRILEMANGVARGAFAERLNLRRSGAAEELVRVGSALNEMAEALGQREKALQDELASSQQARSTQTLIFNSMQEGLWAADSKGNVLLFNELAASMFPVTPTMSRPSDWAAFYGLYAPDTDELLEVEDMPLYRALHGESGRIDIEVRNSRVPDGCMLRCSYRPLTSNGEIIGGLVVFADITDLRAAEQQEAMTYARLRETQRRLVDALRIGRIGNWEYDLETERLWWSDEVHEIFGVPRGQFDGSHDTLLKQVHPDDRETYARLREDALARGHALDVEFRICMRDGSVRWIHQRGELHRDAHGAPTSRAGVVQDITTRKKSEAELFLLRSAVERINDIVMIARVGDGEDGSSRTVFVNGALERLTGHSVDGVLGRDPLLPFSEPGNVAEVERLRAALNDGEPVREQVLTTNGLGEPMWLEFDAVPFASTAGNVDHWILVGRDVSERRHAETALADSEQRYQALFEQAPIPMWVFEERTLQFLAVNNAAAKQYGYTIPEFRRLTLHDMRPPAERARLEQRVSGGYSGNAEGWIHMRKDGTQFPVDVMSHPVKYAGVGARFAVVHDITARVQAEQNLQEYLFTLQRSSDAGQMVVSHQTLQGTLQEVVEQARAVIRAHQGIVTLVNHNDWANSTSAVSMSDKYAAYRDFMTDPDGTGIYSMVCESNRPMRMTQEQLEAHPRWQGFGASAGEHPPMRGWLAVPLVNRRGENIGVLQLTDKYEGEFSLQDEYVAVEIAQLASIALENVTLLEEVRALNSGLEQKVMVRTRELAREQARYQALADGAPQIIWSYEPGRGVTYFNQSWYDLVGGTPDYWLNNRWMEAVHPDDRDASLANWVIARQTRSLYQGERRLRDKYGRYHIMAYRGAPVFDESGLVVSWVGIDTDITEIKSVEAELRESNRELEAFSYSVSHDLRSPLNTIHGFSKLMARELGPNAPERATHYMERIQAAAGYMGQLIEDLLSLAQVSRANLRSEPVDLSEMALAITDRLHQTEPQRDVAVDIELGLVVQGDIRLLRVVLENLIGNAWKFTAHKQGARISVGSLENRTVFFVKDNGAGFDMAYANKLFGMFQRLHAAAEFPGTGIGLATVHRIVTRHRGRVWAESTLGEGASFYWTIDELPALTAAPAEGLLQNQ